MPLRRALAIDLGASHAAFAIFAASPQRRLVLQRFAVATHLSNEASEERWTERAAQSLASIAHEVKRAAPCTIALPGLQALVKLARTPWLDPVRRAKMVEFEAAQNIPFPLEEVVWDHAFVGDDGLDVELMFVAAKREAIAALVRSAEVAGLPLERIVPASVGLLRAFRYNYPDVHDSVLVANVGARSTHLVFVEGERCFIRTLALGGNTITQRIADELRLEFGEAESLKMEVLSGRGDFSVHSPLRAVVSQAAAQFAARLHLEIKRSAMSCHHHRGFAQPSAIYLTGGASLDVNLATALAERLQLRVESYAPLRRVELSSDAQAAGAEMAAPRLAELIGLATPLVDKMEPALNLLPRAHLAELGFRRRQPILLATVALGVAAISPVAWHFHSAAGATEEGIAAMETRLKPLRVLATRNADTAGRIDTARRQIATIQELVGKRTSWVRFLDDLQGRLVKVEDVWLEEFRILPPAGTESNLALEERLSPGERASQPPLRLSISGRLLDAQNPLAKVSPESHARVKRLLQLFMESQFVAAVENERFDQSQDGILRFDFTLVLDAEGAL